MKKNRESLNGFGNALVARLQGALLLRDFLCDPLDDSNYERVAHAESSLVIAHTFSPTTRKAVELFQFLRNQATKFAASCFDDVLEARRGRTTFSSKDCARWSVKWVREGQRALCVEVSRSRALMSALLVLCTLQILPRADALCIQE